eukprot:4470762-Pyramimonas_sp.AAC.1
MEYIVHREQRDRLVGRSGIFLRACEASGVSHIPKHHLLVHLADRTSEVSIGGGYGFRECVHDADGRTIL